MARRKEGAIEAIAKMPWPVGIVLGVLAYWAIRYGFGWYFSGSGNPFLHSMGKVAATGIYAPIAWIVMVVCWIGAFGSWLGGRRRKRLLETRTGIDSLRAMSWRELR